MPLDLRGAKRVRGEMCEGHSNQTKIKQGNCFVLLA